MEGICADCGKLTKELTACPECEVEVCVWCGSVNHDLPYVVVTADEPPVED